MPTRTLRTLALLLPLLAGSAVWAQSSCSSDGRKPPLILLERYTNADCDACWSDRDTSRDRAGELPLDWIVPGAKGDDAPLSAAARPEGLARLEALGLSRPVLVDTRRTWRKSTPGTLRVAHGLPFNGYIGASIEWKARSPGPATAWLALVETLPAGTEGSPVRRNLVRNVLQVSWPAGTGRRFESRPMNIPEGAKPERLRVVGWVEDARGVIRAISESVCAPEGRRR